MAAGSATAAASEGQQWLDSDQFAIAAFSTASGSPQAGARADFTVSFALRHGTRPSQPGRQFPYGRAKRLEVGLPAGMAADLDRFPGCPRATFVALTGAADCPAASRVGTATVLVVEGGSGELTGPVIKLDPGPDEPALLGIKLSSLDLYVELEADSAGRLTAAIDEIPSTSPPIEGEITLWGVPADHGAPGPRVPLLAAPTGCGAGAKSALRAISYEGRSDARSFAEPPRTGCGSVPFEPTAELTLGSRTAGSPTGLTLTLRNPAEADPDKPAAAHLRDATLALPEGLAVSASAAAGLGACAAAEFGYGRETPIACPPSSKVGEVTVRTPLVAAPLTGPVYAAAQDDNPFGSLLALYLAPAGSGIELKIAGRVDLDPASGRVSLAFPDLPQQPFTQMEVRLNHGPRALLALPRGCGTRAATARLSSWARPSEPVALAAPVPVDQGCERAQRFTPGLRAGTLDPRAGAPSPLIVRLTREDDAQPNVERLRATLPAGLVAKLAGVPLCAERDLARSACPGASAIGTLTLGAGAGPTPLFLPAPGAEPVALHLAGPYRGAPYSVFAAVPARIGPFDLGTVALRGTLELDPVSARMTLSTDPLPQILRGIPIGYRDIRIEIDRSGFVLNPTSCAPRPIEALVTSAAGDEARVADRFRAGGCGALPFRPWVALSADGRTHRSAHPRLRVAFRMPAGDANVRRARLVLPPTFNLEHAHVRAVCSAAEYAARSCPPSAIHGRATVWTPLLDRPLSGPVYLRASRNRLPDLGLALDGPIRLDLVGRVDSANGRLVGTFAGLPDAPISRLALTLRGGRGGLVVNNTELCGRRLRANLRLVAHSGRVTTLRPAIARQCKRQIRRTGHRRGGS